MHLQTLSSLRVYRTFAWPAVAMLLVMLLGTVGYRLLGGPQYSWMDCFYMTFITVATIGFHEVVDLSSSTGGRLFTVFIATLGIATMTYMLSSITAFILEGDLNEAWRRKKMQKRYRQAERSLHRLWCGACGQQCGA